MHVGIADASDAITRHGRVVFEVESQCHQGGAMLNDRAVTSRSSQGFSALIKAFSLGAGLLGFALPAFAASDSECPPPQKDDRSNWKSPDCGVHNMFVVGEKAMFISHLPMFDSEHRYQIILQAKLKREGQDVTPVYLKDRVSHPQSKMYTLEPSDFFILSRVMGKDGSAPSRKSFDATVFRGHLERNPHQVIPGLDKAEVEVQKLIYGAEVDGPECPAARAHLYSFWHRLRSLPRTPDRPRSGLRSDRQR